MNLSCKKTIFLLVLAACWCVVVGAKTLPEFTDSDEEKLKAVMPHTQWGDAIYLYSEAGDPYRCFVQQGAFPLKCRRATPEESRQLVETDD